MGAMGAVFAGAIIGKTHDDHVPVGMALPPLLRPEIEQVGRDEP
jgi:hypothetical protein